MKNIKNKYARLLELKNMLKISENGDFYIGNIITEIRERITGQIYQYMDMKI